MKIYVVLVNYNRWFDTVECLESLLRSDYPDFQVIIVENGSNDDSFASLLSWAKGDLAPPLGAFKEYTVPPVVKPLPYLTYRDIDGEINLLSRHPSQKEKNPLIFIQVSPNRGFALGNNVGIKYALSQKDAAYLWILNNDTVVPPDSLSALASYSQAAQERRVGMVGSKLFYYHERDKLQAVGGKYNKWLALSKHIGAFEKDIGQFDQKKIEMDYIVCASVLIPRAFFHEVGLMEEKYFLYFEDLDWAERAKRLGWKMELCPQSRVFHKEGGSKGDPRAKSDLVDYYHLKNRFVFTRKFYPYLLPFVYLTLMGIFVRRIKRKKYRMAWQVFRFLCFQFS